MTSLEICKTTVGNALRQLMSLVYIFFSFLHILNIAFVL